MSEDLSKKYPSYAGTDMRVRADGEGLGAVQGISWKIDRNEILVDLTFLALNTFGLPFEHDGKHLTMIVVNEYAQAVELDFGKIKFKEMRGGLATDDIVTEYRVLYVAEKFEQHIGYVTERGFVSKPKVSTSHLDEKQDRVNEHSHSGQLGTVIDINDIDFTPVDYSNTAYTPGSKILQNALGVQLPISDKPCEGDPSKYQEILDALGTSAFSI